MTRETTVSHTNIAESKLVQVQVGNYKFTGRVLGKGSFAVIREALHTQLKVHVSVKITDLRKCNGYMLKNYLREAKILKDLDHPYIMKLFETMKFNNMYYMVTELIQGGDLCAYVQQKKGNIEEIVTRRFSRQIASALRYLHQKGIVHRDLKLENVMLDSSKRNVKLIDFGLTNNWSMESPLKTLCGSPEYCAPELFVPGTEYGPEVDMWALGVIMFALAAGRLPFPCLSTIMRVPEKKSLFLKKINEGLSEAQTKLIRDYSAGFLELIQGLMNPKWTERLTISDVFKDPWVTNRDHWADVPHESLDAFDKEKIIQQVSFKLKTTRAKLEAELKANSCGEVGGVINIMTHQKIIERRRSHCKTVSSETGYQSSLYPSTPSKKRGGNQIPEGPIKISLLGNEMKLNEVPFGSRLNRRNASTPSSSTTSGSSSKPDDFVKKHTTFVLPKIKDFKLKYPASFDVLKNQAKKADKSAQVNLSTKRKLTFGKIILPSKLEMSQSAKSFDEQQAWCKI